MTRCSTTANGGEHRLSLDPRTTLLDALREHLHLTGSKKGCGLGQCGCAPQKLDRGQLDQLEARETGYGMIGA